MATARFGRVITAMITPFADTGEIDYDGAVSLARYLVNHGSEGLLVAGTTGEGATMTDEEKLKLYRLITEAVGDKVSVIGNVGTIGTKNSIEFLKKAEKTGIDAALAIVPFYVKPNQEGIYRHFKAISEASSIPLILYNVPGRVGTSITPETIKRLTDVCPNIVGIKDATGSWDQVTLEKMILPDDFMIYSGDDAFTLPILAAGGVGVISVASHIIGNDLLDMVKSFQEGKTEKARMLHMKMYRFMKGMFFTASPIPVKTAVNIIGEHGGRFRLPLVDPTKDEKEKIEQLIKEYGL